jgi:hypothetical protein
MKKITRLVTILFLFIAITNCAHQTLKPEEKSKIKELGIIQLFDDTLPVSYVGTTIFNNKANSANISAWDLPNLIQEDIKKNLSSVGIKVKSVKIDADAIKAANEKDNTITNKTFGTPGKYVDAYLSQAAKDQNVDYLLVLKPLHGHDNFPGFAGGFAMHCRSAFGAQGEWKAYSMYSVSIWNTITKKRVFGTAYTPNDTGVDIGKKCDEADKNISSFVNKQKSVFANIAKDVATAPLKQAGFLN